MKKQIQPTATRQPTTLPECGRTARRSNSDKLRQAQSNSLFSQIGIATILLESALRFQPSTIYSPNPQPPSIILPPPLLPAHLSTRPSPPRRCRTPPKQLQHYTKSYS